jgi:hypothetical protein
MLKKACSNFWAFLRPLTSNGCATTPLSLSHSLTYTQRRFSLPLCVSVYHSFSEKVMKWFLFWLTYLAQCL